MNKRLIALVIALLLALSLACEDDVVISDGGVSTERDTMIYEATQN